MSPLTDLRRRPEAPPAFVDTEPACHRSEAFAEDLGELLLPPPQAPRPAAAPPCANPVATVGS